MSSTKTERLLTLLKVLLDTPRLLTAAEIRERVGGYAEGDVAFRRTFERDKAELSEMLGHPLRAEPVPGVDPPVEGYRLRPEDAYLRDPGLSPEERRALAVAASAVRLAGIDPTRGARKVGAPVDDTAPGAATTEIPVDSTVIGLFQAVAEHREVSFTYRGESRTVQPQRLRFTRGRWYLTGHDTGRGAERQFRVDRFESGATLGPAAAFASRPVADDGAVDEPWTMGEGPAETVRVLFDADRAESARRSAPRAPVEELADGGVILTFSVRYPEALIGMVLGFVDGAEILEPPSVRAAAIEWLRLVADGASR